MPYFMKYFEGEDPEVMIEVINSKWHSITDRQNKSKRDKALMLALYKRMIGRNTDLTGQQKASMMNRNVTDM